MSPPHATRMLIDRKENFNTLSSHRLYKFQAKLNRDSTYTSAAHLVAIYIILVFCAHVVI